MGLLGGHDNVVLETGAIRRFNGRTVFFVVLMCFGSMTYGYSAGITGSILGQPSFLEYMGLLTSSNANALIGAMNGLYYTGGFFGVVTNGWFVDRFGRKASITFGALLVLVASALLAGSVDMGMFIAFRFVSGFGAYILVMTVPVWISETVPPGLRGSFSLCHGICINAGYLIAAYCSFGFYIHVHGGLSVWRGPMALGTLPPLILLSGMYWIPESPRYLLMKGHEQRAWEIVKALHSSPNDTEHEYARKEIFQMRKQMEFDKTLDSSWGVLFRRPSYRKRALMAIIVVCTIISSGAQVIASYGTILFADLGFDSTKQLLFFAGLYCMSTGGHPVALLYIDRIPRNRLIGGALYILMAITATYTGLTGVYLNSTNTSAQAAAVAMTYLFFFIYGASVDAPTFLYNSELFPTHLRGKGMTFGMSAYALISLVWTMSGPTAIANIKWGFFTLMVLLTFVGATIIFFFFPDTKGKTLEEIAALFGDDDLVAVYQRDIHLASDHHEIVADVSYDHGGAEKATETVEYSVGKAVAESKTLGHGVDSRV